MPLDAMPGTLPGTTVQVDEWASGAAGDAGIASGLGTGQHGITPLTGGAGIFGAIANGWQALTDWLKSPITGAIAPTSVFLLVGAVIVSVILWNLILYHVRIAAESL